MKRFFFDASAKLLPSFLGTKGKNRLSILIYHRVLPGKDELFPNEVTWDVFDWQMELLVNYFHPLSLSEALDLMDERRLPERAVCVTFDDGYADNEQIALPILKKWRIPATVFVASGYLNGGRMWNDTVIETVRAAKGSHVDMRAFGLGEFKLENVSDQRQAIRSIINEIKYMDDDRRQSAVAHLESQASGSLPVNLMMTDEQVIHMHQKGIGIGGHTMTHPILAGLNKNQVQREVAENKHELEQLTGQPVNFFAYPNGKPGKDYRLEQRNIIRDLGFRAALSTHWGAATLDTDRWQLPRFTPWDSDTYKFMVRLIANYRKVI